MNYSEQHVLGELKLGEHVLGESVLGEHVPGESALGEHVLGESVLGEQYYWACKNAQVTFLKRNHN